MTRLLGRLLCRFLPCRIVQRGEWECGEFVGWRDECERCGESQFVGRWRR